MEELENLTHINYITVFFGVFAILFAIRTVIDLIAWFKNKFGIKTGIDTERETIEGRISKLESHDKWQYDKINQITKGIQEIKEQMTNKEIDDIRWELLDFCSALTSGRKYNKEAFEHIFRTYEKYERILEKNGMQNGYVTESMNVAKEMFHNMMSKGEL